MDYDLEQVGQAQRQTLTNLALMAFLYYQFGVVRPLVVQSLLPIRNALAAKVAQVHLFGKPAEGVLSRPWKVESLFAALLGGPDQGGSYNDIAMKIQVISLLLVATSAMAQMNSMESAPSVQSLPTYTTPLSRRTLIGDEYTVNNQVDNSRGKQTFSIDHNGDSSVHKGLLYDLVDPSSRSGTETDRFFRRSLLGDLLGGSRTTIENVNDNSQHRQTMNSHGNKNIRVSKTEEKYGSPKSKGFFERDLTGEDNVAEEVAKRSLLGGLFGGDSTSISNVNDNSKHSQTMNSHGNKNVRITKVHKEQNTGYLGEMSPENFFDRRDLAQDQDQSQDNISKRSLLGGLFGGDSTSISNVNDNSKHTQTMNSHGNKNIQHSTNIHKEQTMPGRGNHGMSPTFFDKRSLLGDLVGTSDTSISNVNDNSKHTQKMNSHGNRYSSETRIHKEVTNSAGVSTAQDTSVLARRGLLFGGKSTSISNVNDNSQETKTLNSHGNKVVVDKSYVDRRGRHGDMYRRGLLLGGDVLNVSNENYNGRESKTLNEHDNVDKTVVYQEVVGEDAYEGEDEMLGLAKRDSISVSNVNDNSRTTKTMNSYNNVYYQESVTKGKVLGRKRGGPRRMDA
ncbi:hypothetical protein BGZ52_005436 [Haplosporangium bisporale]|nr:hypothetical protein BGZ52_005436 [Haplosporangium bisporale]